MSNVANILNSKPNSDVFAARHRNYDEAVKCMQSEDKPRYSSLSQLQDAGLLGRYSVITRNLIRNESYKIPVSTAKEKLGQEELLIKDLRDALNQWDMDSSQPDQVLGSQAQRANNALKIVQDILNRKDGNGRYILGGINPNKQPCEDLVALSNIVDGVSTSNYTDSTPNKQEVEVCEGISVQFGLCASETAFKQVIATINKIKQGDVVDAASLKQEALRSLDLLALDNGENQQKVEKAKEYNSQSDIRLHKELEENFSVSQVAATQRVNDSMQVLMESMNLMMKQHKLDEAFNQAF
jgi:hypothetical protein